MWDPVAWGSPMNANPHPLLHVAVVLALVISLACAQSPMEIPLSSEEVEDFGACLLAADLDGDGKAELLVGAPRFAAADRHRIGRMQVFRGQASLETLTSRSWIGESSGSLFGHSLALGDTNGDGFQDLLAGAPGTDRSKGAAYLVLGGKGGGAILAGGDLTQSRAAMAIRGSLELAALGSAVAMGDLDGDGLADLALGEPMASLGSQRNCGRVHLLKGSKTLRTTLSVDDAKSGAEVRVQGREEEALGHHIATFDVNGDGCADLILGSPWYHEQDGALIVILGGKDFFKARRTISLDLDGVDYHLLGAPKSRLGESVAGGSFGPEAHRFVLVVAPATAVRRDQQAGAFHAIPWPPEAKRQSLQRRDTTGVRTWPGAVSGERVGTSLQVIPASGGTGSHLLVGSGGVARAMVFADPSDLLPSLRPSHAPMPKGAKGGASAVTAGDLNGDGEPNWILGTPESNRVTIFASPAK